MSQTIQMKSIKTLGLAVSLGLLFLIPTAAFADDHRDDPRHHRYWDEEHHDYHHWDRHEDRYWRLYWTRDRGPFITFEHANAEQRRAYWHWRHEHEHDHY